LQESFFFFYNDQKPGEQKSHGNRAHAKGVTFFGKTSGFWLVHSVPRFPSIKKYSYPENAEVYGQSFLCVTMKTESIGAFAEAMKYIGPAAYHMNLPEYFSDRFPFLKELKILRSKKNINSSLIQTFNSIGGLKFYDFLKTKKFDRDLYMDFIAKTMGISLFTETWMNGGAIDLNSECETSHKISYFHLNFKNQILFHSTNKIQK
uniref:Deoxyribonuclease II n=1 Tax=Onchocerca flexuosa TaxID=387005 RepID=A0A183HWN7_9BILA